MKFEEDFDFETANAQFHKDEIDKELQNKLKLKGKMSFFSMHISSDWHQRHWHQHCVYFSHLKDIFYQFYIYIYIFGCKTQMHWLSESLLQKSPIYDVQLLIVVESHCENFIHPITIFALEHWENRFATRNKSMIEIKCLLSIESVMCNILWYCADIDTNIQNVSWPHF